MQEKNRLAAGIGGSLLLAWRLRGVFYFCWQDEGVFYFPKNRKPPETATKRIFLRREPDARGEPGVRGASPVCARGSERTRRKPDTTETAKRATGTARRASGNEHKVETTCQTLMARARIVLNIKAKEVKG